MVYSSDVIRKRMDLKLAELHIFNQSEGIYMYIKRKNMAVHSSLDQQVMETRKCCVLGVPRLRADLSPGREGRKGYEDGTLY